MIHDQNLDGLGKLNTSMVLGYYTYFSVYTVISFIIYHIEVTLQISNKKKNAWRMCVLQNEVHLSSAVSDT